MTMSLRIRPCEPADTAALARLCSEVHALHVAGEPERYRPLEPGALEAWMADFFRKDEATGVLAERDGEVLGYALGRLASSEGNPFLLPSRTLYVDQVGVAAAARRRGIGRALMAAIEASAETLGADAVVLDVRGFNEAARAFYESLGYSEARRTMWRPIEGGDPG